MICDKCGYDETESITICQKCGTELVTEDDQSVNSETQENIESSEDESKKDETKKDETPKDKSRKDKASKESKKLISIFSGKDKKTDGGKSDKKKKGSKSKEDKSKLSKNLIYIIISAVSIFIIAGTVIFILNMGKNASDPAGLNAPPPTPDLSSFPFDGMPGGPDDFPGGFPGDGPGDSPSDGPVGGPGGPPGPDGSGPRQPGPVDANTAREIAQEWLDGVVIWEDVTLESGDRSETADGQDFFRFDPVGAPVDRFAILVHKSTGHLYHMPIEGGGNAGSPKIEALDTWLNRMFGAGTPSADIYAAIRDPSVGVDINIHLFSGEHVRFFREAGGGWVMYDSDGQSNVNPDFTKEDGFLAIRIPPAPPAYQLNDGFEGEFEGEQLRWNYSIS